MNAMQKGPPRLIISISKETNSMHRNRAIFHTLTRENTLLDRVEDKKKFPDKAPDIYSSEADCYETVLPVYMLK